jgi:hypothetical protein
MHYTNNLSDASEAMRALRSLGVTEVNVHFSGGNDSGGADSLVARDANGNEVPIPQSGAHTSSQWDPNTRTWIDTGWVVNESTPTGWNERPATQEEIRWARIGEVLEQPIYDRWGTFAGDFEVDGTLTWNVLTGTHELHGQESMTSWQDF